MNNIEKLNQFIKNNAVDYSDKTIDIANIENYESKIDLKMGKQLIEYITKYGYLGYKSIEFYGINSKQELNSDLIKQTIYLHEYYDITKPYIAIENVGDNIYATVDSNDNVFICDLVTKNIKNINLKLFEYIIKRFNEIK